MNQDSLNLETENCKIELRHESIYTSNSADNKFVFDKELFLDDEEDYVSSKHSVTVSCRNGETHSCILLAGGGSGVHNNSALLHDEKLLVAVGDFVCCLSLPTLDVVWRTKTDWATCFGIYHSPRHKCCVSHGECDIARLSYFGEIIWQTSGKDIFTGDFILHEDFISLVDFNDENYLIKVEDGVCRLTEG